MDVQSALRHLTTLYSAALKLPSPFTGGTARHDTNIGPPADSIGLVSTRAGQLPVKTYWTVFDPLCEAPGESVAGSIVDDLQDVYRDVARGLILFETGDRAEAHWAWSFNFRIHWGAHVTSALRALHAYSVEGEPEG